VKHYIHEARNHRLAIGCDKRILGLIQDGSQVAQNGPELKQTEHTGQVLHFRPRRRPVRPLFSGSTEPALSGTAPDDDFAEFEQEEAINYRQRMLMNVIAVAIVTLLVVVGVWIADTIAEMEKDQDCMLQGRGNCGPIEVPVPRLH
jgi:hypothetical protein